MRTGPRSRDTLVVGLFLAIGCFINCSAAAIRYDADGTLECRKGITGERMLQLDLRFA